MVKDGSMVLGALSLHLFVCSEGLVQEKQKELRDCGLKIFRHHGSCELKYLEDLGTVLSAGVYDLKGLVEMTRSTAAIWNARFRGEVAHLYHEKYGLPFAAYECDSLISDRKPESVKPDRRSRARNTDLQQYASEPMVGWKAEFITMEDDLALDGKSVEVDWEFQGWRKQRRVYGTGRTEFFYYPPGTGIPLTSFRAVEQYIRKRGIIDKQGLRHGGGMLNGTGV